jgi:hypothetical protein
MEKEEKLLRKGHNETARERGREKKILYYRER